MKGYLEILAIFIADLFTCLRYFPIILLLACLLSCNSTKNVTLIVPVATASRMTGSDFFRIAAAWNWKRRDSMAVQQILSGNIPSFLRKFTAVHVSLADSTGTMHRAVLYVSLDYLAVGTNEDWARVPLTPMAAQRIADSFHCFLPTRKIADLVYEQALIKCEPVPLFAFRDSSVTMWQHHLIIEGQRKNKKGLIAGIKKDVVISGMNKAKPDRVAIYGWHRADGKPIQPLYTGHVNWYVDYSHGARLVYAYLWVDGKKMQYADVLKHPVYHSLICDEADCLPFRYSY